MKTIIHSLIFSVILFFQQTAVFSQNVIKGSIKDNYENDLPFATISLITAKDSVIKRGLLSDESGKFTISQVDTGSYFIRISYIGMEDYVSSNIIFKDDISLNDLGNVQLKQSNNMLSEIQVKSAKPLIEQGNDRVILNIENSVISKGNKVVDMLRYTPLVKITDNRISVANKNNILFLIDGKQMGQTAVGNFINNFSSEDIVKIEVITNPSAKYDAEFGAVINITTKKIHEKGINGRFSIIGSKGIYSRFTPDASWNYRNGKINIFGSVNTILFSQYFTDQTLNRSYNDFSLHNDVSRINKPNSYATFWGLDYNLNSRTLIGIRFSASNNNGYNYVKTKSFFIDKLNVIDSSISTLNNGSYKQKSYDLNLNYDLKIDSNGRELSVNLTYTPYKSYSYQNVIYNKENSINYEKNIIDVVNNSNQFSLIFQTDYTPVSSKNFKLNAGLKNVIISNNNQFLQTQTAGNNIDNNEFVDGLYKEVTHGAYTSISGKINDKINLQAGLRVENTSQSLTSANLNRSYLGIFPNAGLTFVNKDYYTIGINASRKIRRPSLSSLVPFRQFSDPYTVVEGNPFIKPQFSHSIDSYLNVNNLKGVTFFANYNFTKDFITDLLTVDENTKIYSQKEGNLDSVHEIYLGSNYSKNVSKWWQTNNSFTLNTTNVNTQFDSKIKLNGYGFSGSTTNIFNLGKNWKGELSIYYNSPNRWNIWWLQSLFWVNSSITKEVFKNGTIKFSFQDIFRSQVTRLKLKYDLVNIESKLYNDTRRIQFSFSYNFGKKTVKSTRYLNTGNDTEKQRMNNR